MSSSAAVPSKPGVGWSTILACVQPGPESKCVARTTGALQRERAVNGVEGLLRMALSYGACNLSLKATAEWCQLNGSAQMTQWGVLNRLRNCGDWLMELVTCKLCERTPVEPIVGYRVHIVDATRVASPGSKGKTHRLHALYDPFAARLVDVELTDDRGGEHLRRFTFGPGDLVVGDQGYANARGLASVAASGADFLIRTNAHNVPLVWPDGTPFDFLSFLRGRMGTEPVDVEVRTRGDERHGIASVACRLVVLRKSDKAAERARKKVIAEAKRKKRTPKESTLEACNFVLVLVSAKRAKLDSAKVLELYRLRWQVEMAFKRMKSLLDFDVLRAKDAQLVRATLAAKLLAVLLVEEFATKLKMAVDWASTSIVGMALRQAILGSEAADRVLSGEKGAVVLKSNGPRKRQRQLSRAKAFLSASA